MCYCCFLNYDCMIFYKMLKMIKKQRDNDAPSSQAQKKKRLPEFDENSHELPNHEEAYEDVNSKFSIIICFCYFVLPNM